MPNDASGTTFFMVTALELQRTLVLYSTAQVIAVVPRSLRHNPKLGFYSSVQKD